MIGAREEPLLSIHEASKTFSDNSTNSASTVYSSASKNNKQSRSTIVKERRAQVRGSYFQSSYYLGMKNAKVGIGIHFP